MHRSEQQTSVVTGLRAFSAKVERSRGTGPRATVVKAASLHRRARACPSPCTDLSSKPPWSLGCGRFPQRLRDRGGQAPALRLSRRPPFIVGRGPSHATRAGERVSRAIVPALQRSRGTGPRATEGEKPYGRVETGRSLLPGRH